MRTVARDGYQFNKDFGVHRFDVVPGDWKPYQNAIKNAVRRTCEKWGMEYVDSEAQVYYDKVPDRDLIATFLIRLLEWPGIVRWWSRPRLQTTRLR